MIKYIVLESDIRWYRISLDKVKKIIFWGSKQSILK